MAFAQCVNFINRENLNFQLNNDETIQDAYVKILSAAKLISTEITDEEKTNYLQNRAIIFDAEKGKFVFKNL